jgi:hypothetical protein
MSLVSEFLAKKRGAEPGLDTSRAQHIDFSALTSFSCCAVREDRSITMLCKFCNDTLDYCSKFNTSVNGEYAPKKCAACEKGTETKEVQSAE